MDTRVKHRVERFVRLINKRTGISNSFDYNHCIDMCEDLTREAIPFDPEEIYIWLVMHAEIFPQDAKEIKRMLQRIAAGKRVKRKD